MAGEMITAQPDIEGPHGKAWKVDLHRARKIFDTESDADASLVVWVISAPWAHPVWHSYVLTLCDLVKPLASGPPKIYMDGATHEIDVMALDPSEDNLDRLIAGDELPRILTPINFSAQMVEIEDKFAIERVERSVREICDGKLSPDTDYTWQWVERYGDNMMKGKSPVSV